MLTRIVVDAKSNRLLVDTDLYTRLPCLTSIDLSDETFEYRCLDVLASSRQPGYLAKVELLELQGWPAFTFHPATLESTTQLRNLQLSTRNENFRCYIAPVDELDRMQSSDMDQDDLMDGGEGGGSVTGDSDILRRRRQPRWTWDWHLIHLSCLCLIGEVAYRFEFRMLQGCPALYYFELSTHTAERQHTRILSRKDLILPHSNNNNNYSNNIIGPGHDPSEPSRRIVVPSLTMLIMKGVWEMEDDELLAEFLMGMFPNLRSLSEEGGWCGETMGGLIKVIQSTTCEIQDVSLNRPLPSEEEALELSSEPARHREQGTVLVTILGARSGIYNLVRNPLAN